MIDSFRFGDSYRISELVHFGKDQLVFSQLLNRGKEEKKMGEDHFHHLQPDHNYRPPPSYGYKVEAPFPCDIVLVLFGGCDNSLAAEG